MKQLSATLVVSNIELSAGRSQEWFDGLRPSEQKKYLKEHPGSKFGKKSAKPTTRKSASISRLDTLIDSYNPESGKGARPLASHVNKALEKTGALTSFHRLSSQAINLTNKINKAKASGEDYTDLMEKRRAVNTRRLTQLKDALGPRPVAELRKLGSLARLHKPAPSSKEPAVEPVPVKKGKAAPAQKPTAPTVPEAERTRASDVMANPPKIGFWKMTFDGSEEVSDTVSKLLTDEQRAQFVQDFDYYSRGVPKNPNSDRNRRYGEDDEISNRWYAGRKVQLQKLAEAAGLPYSDTSVAAWAIVANNVFKRVKAQRASGTSI